MICESDILIRVKINYFTIVKYNLPFTLDDLRYNDIDE